MRHSARFERHQTDMPQQRSGVVDGSIDESTRAFVHKLLSHAYIGASNSEAPSECGRLGGPPVT